MKKIVLINPVSQENFWSLKATCNLMGRVGLTPPLQLATVAGLTPPHYKIQIVDENIEEIDFDIECDFVGITGYTDHRERMQEISKAFQDRGKLVVGGGAYCSAHPDEAKLYFNVVISGEAERIWPQFLLEWEQGIHRSYYHESEKPDLQRIRNAIPRFDLIDVSKYMVGMVQTSRGCPYDCEFCDVVSLLGNRIRYKPKEHVVEEVKQLIALGVTEIFFADDHFTGNKKYAKALLKVLIELNQLMSKPVRFMTQVTLNCADDEELLDLFKKANFGMLFIGIETPKIDSLLAANKAHNMKQDLKQSVHKIQSRGLLIIPGMIVGFDTDDVGIFALQETFLKDAGLMFPMLGLLVATKGTKLWERLELENRLVSGEYGNSFLETNIIPKLMKKQDLEKRYQQLLHKVYSVSHFKESFKSFLSQIDIDEIRKDSHVSNLMDFRKSHFIYQIYGIKVIWSFLTGGARERKLLWYVLKKAFLKSRYCIPLAINALAYYRGFGDFVRRHNLYIKKYDSEIRN